MEEKTQEKIESFRGWLPLREKEELYRQAEELFSSPVGQKILRELDAMDAATHGMPKWIDDEHTYAGSDYEDGSEKFTITDYREAIFIPQLDRLFLTDDPFDPHGLLERRMEREIHGWEAIWHELDSIFGQFALIKGYKLKLFARLGRELTTEKKLTTTKGLIGRGILLLEYWEERPKLKERDYPEYQKYLKMPFEEKTRFLEELKRERKRLSRPPPKFRYKIIHA